MSANSGIEVAPELLSSFVNANTANDVRFIKVSIDNEILVHDLTIPVNAGSFEDDLLLLQNPNVLENDTPAYILARVAQSDWLAISYVPDSAKVRDKMLYASTRASLFKALGSTLITDTIFATSKADLTSEAYVSHKRHIAAPKPLSAREQEMADIRNAESGSAYEGSRTRVSHVGTGVGLNWPQEVEEAVRKLGGSEDCSIVIIEIDGKTETLKIRSTSETSVESLASTLPSSEPCYAFFAWPHTHTYVPKRDIIFIYSCPSNSPIKDRMIYSSGVSSTYLAAKTLLLALPSPVHIASRKIETSNPEELNGEFLKEELGLSGALVEEGSQGSGKEAMRVGDERKPFAKPKGPARKR